jgi:hypothetical protein
MPGTGPRTGRSGCVGRVANGINTVHVSLVREGTGHALAGARQWIPREHIEDPVTSLVMGLPLDLEFRTTRARPCRCRIGALCGVLAGGVCGQTAGLKRQVAFGITGSRLLSGRYAESAVTGAPEESGSDSKCGHRRSLH